MMNKHVVILIFTLLLCTPVYAEVDLSLCNSENYTCIMTNDYQRVVIPRKPKRSQSFNRADAVRKPTRRTPPPVPSQIDEKDIIKVDLNQNIWAAYDENGSLVRSGPASGGRDFCPDTGERCKTVTGTYTIFRKEGADCYSKIYPVGKGGAPMPFCMFFHEGFSLHGSSDVPDFNASHGCIRLIPDDAQWLNLEFVQLGKTRVSIKY
jgi:lipoprotein-anchoring transpeptidase ErfK/SrfK